MLRLIFVLGALAALIVYGLFASGSLVVAGSENMMPNIESGQRLQVNKLAYGVSTAGLPLIGSLVEPRRLVEGDVPEPGDIVFYLDESVDRPITRVGRVVAVGPTRVAYSEGRLIIDEMPVERRSRGENRVSGIMGLQQTLTRFEEVLPNGASYEIFEQGDDLPLDNIRPVIVPAGYAFVLGDNRDASRDSRLPNPRGTGPIALTHIIGRVDS